MLFAGTRSPFTYGLEIELRKLAQLDDEAVRNTALGLWLRGEDIEPPPPEDRPILEVLPLNTEQRQAVVQGVSAPLTVVTGPPGTGKSQVVTSLLVNLAWQGGSALFSSKNNHAVDVVESRVNALGSYPLLLRLGKEEHHARIAQNLTADLAASSNPDDSAGYAWLTQAHEQDRARFASVQREITAVVSLRNTVDELERAAEPARALFGPDRFAALRTLDIDGLRRRVEALTKALDEAKESGQALMVRFVRRAHAAMHGSRRRQESSARAELPARTVIRELPNGRRFRRVAEAAGALLPDAERLGMAPPGSHPGEHNLEV